MHLPQLLGEDLRVLLLVTRDDRARDDELTHVDRLILHRLIEHLRVSGLPGEADGGPGEVLDRLDGRAAVDEEHRTALQEPHALQHLVHCGHRPIDRELHSGLDIGHRGFQQRTQELLLRQWVIAEDLDIRGRNGAPVLHRGYGRLR